MNANEHYRNRLDYSQDKLARHAGKYVAWSGDGTDILASADAVDELVDAVDAAHPIGTEFIISFVPPAGETGSRPLGLGLAPASESSRAAG